MKTKMTTVIAPTGRLQDSYQLTFLHSQRGITENANSGLALVILHDG
jgi:hypothetical protein